MTDTGWHPVRWWRVVYISAGDGIGVWCETSDENEARRALSTCPGGGILRRQWRREQQQWRDVDDQTPLPPLDDDRHTSFEAAIADTDQRIADGAALDDARAEFLNQLQRAQARGHGAWTWPRQTSSTDVPRETPVPRHHMISGSGLRAALTLDGEPAQLVDWHQLDPPTQSVTLGLYVERVQTGPPSMRLVVAQPVDQRGTHTAVLTVYTDPPRVYTGHAFVTEASGTWGLGSDPSYRTTLVMPIEQEGTLHPLDPPPSLTSVNPDSDHATTEDTAVPD